MALRLLLIFEHVACHGKNIKLQKLAIQDAMPVPLKAVCGRSIANLKSVGASQNSGGFYGGRA